jgi:coenzyme F420-0:L-glutamate ligase/coenzyme F420-1:gamma-L-glutamate ligase
MLRPSIRTGGIMPPRVTITGLDGIPEVRAGDDIATLVLNAVAASNETLQDGDLLVVTHKIISKAEGQLIDLRDIQPSELAQRHAERWDKDPRQIEIVLRESARIVRMQQGLIIAETHHGFVCANAAVDASNVASEFVCLLPQDPDASAARLRAEILTRTGIDLPIIISDSFGRAWRFGITNVAIGVSGLAPLVDYRGQQTNLPPPPNSWRTSSTADPLPSSGATNSRVPRVPGANSSSIPRAISSANYTLREPCSRTRLAHACTARAGRVPFR